MLDFSRYCIVQMFGKWPGGEVVTLGTANPPCAGSIPAQASRSPGAGIGRQEGLKIPCPQGRVGSTPTPGTLKEIEKIRTISKPPVAVVTTTSRGLRA